MANAEPVPEAQLKKRPPTPTKGPFTFIVTLTCNNEPDQKELLKLFSEHRPRALATGATVYNVLKSVEGYGLNIYEVSVDYCTIKLRARANKFFQSYDGSDAAETFHKVHAHPEFDTAHQRIRYLHVWLACRVV